MLVLKLCTIAEVLDVFLDQCLRPAHPNPDMLETAYFFYTNRPRMNERIDRFRVDERSIRILKLCGFKNIRIALIISIVFLESNRSLLKSALSNQS